MAVCAMLMLELWKGPWEVVPFSSSSFFWGSCARPECMAGNHAGCIHILTLSGQVRPKVSGEWHSESTWGYLGSYAAFLVAFITALRGVAHRRAGEERG